MSFSSVWLWHSSVLFMMEAAGHRDILTPDLIPREPFPLLLPGLLNSLFGQQLGSLAGDGLALAPGRTQSWLVAGISRVCRPMWLAAGWAGGCKVKMLSVLSSPRGGLDGKVPLVIGGEGWPGCMPWPVQGEWAEPAVEAALVPVFPYVCWSVMVNSHFLLLSLYIFLRCSF